MAGTERAVALVLVAVLSAAAAYEVAIALRWISLGDEPGEAPVGAGYVLAVALLALFASAALFIRLATRARRARHALPAAVVVAAAAFLGARFYSFDPYFAPGLRRHSDDGSVGASWIYALGILSLVAALLTVTRARAGLILGAPVLLLIAFSAFALGLGH